MVMGLPTLSRSTKADNEIVISPVKRGANNRKMAPGLKRTPSWKKLLYLNQPYPDNYTNESFLAQLKRNTTVTKYSYWKLVSDFSLIVVHMSNLFLVVLFFNGTYIRQWNPLWATILSCMFSILGFIFNQSIKKENEDISENEVISPAPYKFSNQKPNIKSFLVMIVILLVLSPVLRSLTRSTSSDSIWAISFILCGANTIFHDYGMDISTKEYKPILSTNISLSNAIVLASRLNSTAQVFWFILFSIQINVLLPLFDFSMRKNYPNSPIHEIIVALLFSTVYICTYVLLGYKMLLVWILVQIVIAMVLPAYFLFLQKYKNELQGPWDIAKPVINSIELNITQ